MLKMLLLFFIMILVFLQCQFIFAQDAYQYGVVRLFNANRNITGAGSIIKVDEAARTVYILTAYHVIKDIKGSGSPIYVEFHVEGRTIVKEAKDNPQWQRIIFEEENDGFAVIYVEDYLEEMVLPVIFIDDLSEEKPSVRVETFGYDEYGAASLASGNISSLEPMLRYGATVVRPGFSGGPVFNREGFMIGINLMLDEENREIFAVRANAFKPIVDNWIGLPKMQLQVSIDDPPGARDGIVSTEQMFTLKASVREDNAGNLIAPKVKIDLETPEGYQVEGAEIMTVSLHKKGFWRVRAPDEPKTENHITVNTEPEANPPLEKIRISTVKSAELRLEINKPKSSGLTLFVGQSLNVQAVVRNSGVAKLKEPGVLKIDFQPYEFDLVDGNIDQPFVVDKPVKWKLRAKLATTSGNMEVVITSPGKDENDMTVKSVGISDSISVKVQDVPRWRSYIGFPSVLFADDIAVEAELGTKVRTLNILRKGIPLYVVMSGAFGIYGIIEGIDEQEPDELEPYTLGTLSLAIPLGPISLQGGGGLSFYFRDEELYLHLATGIELNLGRFSIQGGVRHIYDKDLSLYSIQMRF